jgi:hypothetical protein
MEFGGVVFVCANQLLLFQVFSVHMEVVKWPMAMALHILGGHHIVLSCLLLFIYMRTPPKFYLESRGRAA